jgi:nucleoid-associated protein YejK
MDGNDFIENDVFVYKEEDSLDEEEQFLEIERTSAKRLKEELERERLMQILK